MISFIVPAHNEQACLGGTLRAIHESARAVGEAYEVIVVNDASTDATAEIARQNGAKVITVNHRQIAATRNSGGRAATGERLFFVDADTTINSQVVVSALKQIDKGAVGGGASVTFDETDNVPLYVRIISFFSVILAQMAGCTGGAFMFCTREAFRATGGFNERVYWSEEGHFALALRREGRFAVLWKTVQTSARRFRTMSGLQIIALCFKAVLSPVKVFTQRSAVQHIWYDSNRAGDSKPTLEVRISNAAALVLLLIVITGPVWGFISWSMTPLGSPLGKIRFVIAAFLCHVGLLFWPVAFIALVNVLRQKRPTSLFHAGAMIAFCTWQGWENTRGVIWIWSSLVHWVVGLLSR